MSLMIAQKKGFVSTMAIPAIVLYVIFRVGVSCYFIWGQVSAIRVFRAAKNSAHQDKIKYMVRKVGWIAAANVGSLILSGAMIGKIYKATHGWILIMWTGILIMITTTLEMWSIPSKTSRANVLKRHREIQAAAQPSLPLRETTVLEAFRSSVSGAFARMGTSEVPATDLGRSSTMYPASASPNLSQQS
eukprot:TRINITY_DN3367_c1_g1_i1.p2 TRINITY_DN3367_c1_g1~~TRINITY_DN3367_c1_g1_i1.p2  ORF type:complete len:189 (+),score=38.89 TRINITY_DN3367_c1_g1_i1:156-722(+)